MDLRPRGIFKYIQCIIINISNYFVKFEVSESGVRAFHVTEVLVLIRTGQVF